MQSWRTVRLGDVAAEVTVGHVGPMADQYRGSGVPFLRSQNVRPHAIDMSDVKFIDEDFHRRLLKSQLRAGDVVTVRTGKPGITAVIPEGVESMNCADLVVIRPGPELSSRYLSYFINSVVTGFISSQLVGAVQQHFNVGSAKGMMLHLPPLQEQRAIAEVLGALDDKIAADKASIESAVKVAAELTRAGSPSRTTVGAVAVLRLVSVDPTDFPSRKVWHYSLPAFDAGMRPIHEFRDDIKSAKFLLEEPAVLVSKLNPRFPRVWNVVTMSVDSSVSSTEFIPLVPVGVSVSVLWACLLDPAFGAALESRVSGTSGSHQRVRPFDIQAAEIADPRTFASSVVGALDALGMHVELTRNGIDKLAALRDTLLPALMSGKLRVRDAEKAVEEVL